MNKISCKTCLDLMPLVKDGVASHDSRKLVKDHLQECKECKELYSQLKIVELADVEIDNTRVLGNIKKKLYSLAGLILIVGSIIGVNLSDSQNVFYNFLIMPLLGGVAYLAFEKRAYIFSLLIFTISMVFQMVNGYLEGYYSSIRYIFYESIIFPVFFAIFFILGIIIFRLLAFAIYGGGDRYE